MIEEQRISLTLHCI